MKAFLKSVLVVLSLAGTTRVKAQVPILNSLPSASATIFLDFDGHTVTGTSWNYNGPIYCGASGLDNNQITTVFNRVAEDYRPFNVNVTTDSAKFLSAPANKRMRVVETVTSDWYGAAGGVAFVGSFTWGDDSPCFVFTALLNYNPKNIAEASSHEAGHTLSLQHQSVYDVNCVKTAEYNSGVGAGEIGWAPIMGVGYYQNLTTWNIGKSSIHCDSVQNDFAVITANNGFGYRADEYAGNFAGATDVPFVGNQFTLNGLIAQNTDQDMIRFTIPANGRFQLDAIPSNVGTANAGSNLDIQATLYNAAQTLVGVYNPSDKLSSLIDSTLTAGIYYLKVEGAGNIYAPNYASLGQYSLSGRFTFSTLPVHKLELTGEVIGDQHKLHWVIEADEAVTKQVLEVSSDGNHFSSLVESTGADRNFNYKPNNPGNLQYRLNVTFDNGRQYYSNIVILKNAVTETGPKLVGNMVTANAQVSSSGNYSYSIFEMSGRMVSRGSLTSGLNTVFTGTLNRGVYIIRYTNGQAQWTEKFIRQ